MMQSWCLEGHSASEARADVFDTSVCFVIRSGDITNTMGFLQFSLVSCLCCRFVSMKLVAIRG